MQFRMIGTGIHTVKCVHAIYNKRKVPSRVLLSLWSGNQYILSECRKLWSALAAHRNDESAYDYLEVRSGSQCRNTSSTFTALPFLNKCFHLSRNACVDRNQETGWRVSRCKHTKCGLERHAQNELIKLFLKLWNSESHFNTAHHNCH